MSARKNFEEDGFGRNGGKLPGPQRNAVLFLAALAVFVVVFWVWQMGNRINAPFNYKTAPTSLSTAEDDYNNLLKNVDTDKDGLSDYDEIYVYETSPYLEDTDSDGISDKKEVDNGTNPLCPQGKICQSVIDTSAAETAETSESSDTGTIIDVSADSLSAEEAALQAALSGTSDAASLRQLLISNGASAEDLDKISDEDLMKSYQETLDSQNQALQ